jgi:hypothetical protein
MPNWCDNSLSVSHSDRDMMQKFADAVREGNLFQTFIPKPENEPDWYEWHIKHWGTKWDISEGNIDLEDDGLAANCWFNTAWGPPIAAYEALKELGFSIDALYNECGMGFAGTWVDGEEDLAEDYYDMFQEEDWRDQIGNSDLLDLLESEYENWLENQEEEEE